MGHGPVIYFWLSIALKNNSPLTLVWAFIVHSFAITSYWISLLFDATSYEPAVWGAVFGNFVAAYINKNMGVNIFLSSLLLGCWAFFGDPSAYFADLAERLTKAKYIGLPPIDLSIAISYLNRFFDDTLNHTIGGQLNPLFFTLNLYASIALFFGLFRWVVLWKKPMEWASSNLDLFLLRLLGVVVLFSHACILIVALTFMALFYERLPPVDEATFSITCGGVHLIGIFSDVRCRYQYQSTERQRKNEALACHISVPLTLFWLPALSYKSAPIQRLKIRGNNYQKISLQKPNKSKSNYRKADLSKNRATASVSDKLFKPCEKFQHEELDQLLMASLVLAKKKGEADEAYPNFVDILEKSDGEINLQTGLGSKLITSVKIALRGAMKAREKEILAEYLSNIFPLKSRPRNLTLDAFDTFEELPVCKNPDEIPIGLNKNDFAKLVRTTLKQKR